MLATPWICMLVQRGAVKAAKRPCITHEMGGNPIEDYSQSGLMAAIHETR